MRLKCYFTGSERYSLKLQMECERRKALRQRPKKSVALREKVVSKKTA